MIENVQEQSGAVLDPSIEEIFKSAGINFWASISQSVSPAEMKLNADVDQIIKDKNEGSTAYVDFERFRMFVSNSAANMAICACDHMNQSALNSDLANRFGLNHSEDDGHHHDSYHKEAKEAKEDDDDESTSIFGRRRARVARSIFAMLFRNR